MCLLALFVFSDGSSGPMSPWNDDALVSLRERLTLNVSMNMGLSDRLEKAEGGFMSRAEAQMVRGLSSNMQQIENVIRILRGKTNEDFATFCTMLRETNHVGWADELEKEAERFKRERKGTCRGPTLLLSIYHSNLVKTCVKLHGKDFIVLSWPGSTTRKYITASIYSQYIIIQLVIDD